MQMCADETNGGNPRKKKFRELKLDAKVFQEATQLMDPLPDPKPSSPNEPAPPPIITDSNGFVGVGIFSGASAGISPNGIQINSVLGALYGPNGILTKGNKESKQIEHPSKITGLNRELRNRPKTRTGDIPSSEIPNDSSSALGDQIVGVLGAIKS